MDEETLEALTAFLDGERADPDAVARALAEPEGRTALLDFALLKAAVRQDRPAPRPEFVASMERRLAGPAVWPRVLAWRRLAAAAGLLLAVLGGFWLGSSSGSRRPEEPGPPVSKRIVHFERGVDWRAVDKEDR